MISHEVSQPLERFDFTRQGRVLSANADQWQIWLDNLTQDFQEKWLAATRSPIVITPRDQLALRFDAIRQRFPNPGIACEMTIGSSAMPSMLVLDRPLALALILQLLGEQTESLPDDRQLSEIENSICEMLFRKLAESISESWPKKERLDYELQRFDSAPHRSRVWEPRKSVFGCSLSLPIGDGEQSILWVLPLDELEELLKHLDEERVEPTRALKQKMEQRVMEIPVPVTVEIGRTQVPVAHLAKLSEGDVLVFQRRISDPLPLLVDNKPKFFGWLGRTGSRQVFKISELPPVKNGSNSNE
jgi:flagellar motor switch protein FliM